MHGGNPLGALQRDTAQRWGMIVVYQHRATRLKSSHDVLESSLRCEPLIRGCVCVFFLSLFRQVFGEDQLVPTLDIAGYRRLGAKRKVKLQEVRWSEG